MNEIIIPNRRQERRGTAADLAAVNEVLRPGEWCLETDTRKVKFGDGVTAWNALPYVGELANLGNPAGDRIVYWDDAAEQFAFLALGTGLTIGSGGDLDVTGGGGGGQAAIQFKDEGTNVGTSGGITSLDVTGAGASLTQTGGAATLNIPGGSGGALTLVGTATVAGSAATTVTLSGLDLATDGRYWFEANVKNATGSNARAYLMFNGDLTATNYFASVVYGQGSGSTTASSVGTNEPQMAFVLASDTVNAVGQIVRDQNGYPKALTHYFHGAFTTAGISNRSSVLVRNNSANVTSVSLSSDVANMLAVGSYLRVWKLT